VAELLGCVSGACDKAELLHVSPRLAAEHLIDKVREFRRRIG
jgi:hypothetical protein